MGAPSLDDRGPEQKHSFGFFTVDDPLSAATAATAVAAAAAYRSGWPLTSRPH